VDLAGLPAGQREITLKQLIGEESGRAFDLSRGPLVRVRLLQLGPTDHVIAYTLHHIISDGWSVGVLNRELSVLYEAFANGRPSPLPELPIQYADFAVWQRKWLQGEVLKKQLEYWNAQLVELSPLLLLTDRRRSKIQNFDGASYQLTLAPETVAALRELCRREGVTFFMALLAGFKVLLNRYSGQEDIAVGTPIANRNRSEIEPLIGFFANTLVMRTDLGGDPTILELLQRIKVVVWGANAHQDLPFEQVVEQLQPERDLTRNPLVQVLFALQNAPDEGVEMEGIVLQPVGGAKVTTRFDLEVHFGESRQGLVGRLIYNTDLFERETIHRMTQHLERVLEGFAKNPEQRISEVELSSEAEREQILANWKRSEAEDARKQGIPGIFEEQVERNPEAVAVVYDDEHLTYRELNERSNQLAHYLRKLGVGPEVRVGICMERSSELIVGFLGVLKAGGAYVPLDPEYPREQLAFMLKDAGTTILLTQERSRPVASESGVAIICLDGLRAKIAEQKQGNLDTRIVQENVAYVSYVLGPNGEFESIGVSHGALSRLIGGGNIFELSPDDNVAQISPVWCGMSHFEIWSALARGSRLTGIRENGARSSSEFIARLKAAKVTTLFLPVLLFNQLAHKDPSFGRGIRQMVLVGGAPELEAVQKVLQHQSVPAKLLHVFGEMEWGAFGVACSADLARNISVVRAGSGTKAYILDRAGNPTAVGALGELHLSDIPVRGCVSRPDWTAQKLIPDAFSQKPGARLCRTGAMVRHMPEGNFEYLGPIGRHVYLHGVRTDLDCLEMLLRAEADVEECFLMVRRTETWKSQLVAYIVTKREFPPEELQGRLAKRLPAHLLPDAYVFLSHLPLNASGQIDEATLNNIEVIDSELMKRWKERLRTLPGVQEAVVTVQKKNETSEPLRLSDLLPNVARQIGR
jgi:non-ribosomal peptide synthetase component F